MEDYRTAFSTNSSIFRRQDLCLLRIYGGAWCLKWELLRTCPGCSVSYTYPFLTGFFFMPNWPNECTQILIRYARISLFSASRVMS